MKNPLKNFLLLFTLFSLTFCGENTSDTEETEDDATEEVAEEKEEKQCKYLYNAQETSVNWAAFKFTEKVEVGGKFDTFEVLSIQEAETPKEILETLEFSIETGSVNSNNPDRDKKIKEQFFGTMANTGQITGKIVSLDGDDSSGKSKVALTMNEKENEIELDYKIEEEKITLTGTINLEDWEAAPAVTALNEICKELHKGNDGVSKLWSEVTIFISSTLTKECE